MNALARQNVGDYLNANFVSSYQKVGTFRIVDGVKQGGNVASYFCTPEGNVLHVVAGAVSADVLLREARWAVDTYKLALLETRGNDVRLKAYFRKVHVNRLWRDHKYDIRAGASPSDRPTLVGQGRVHRILALYPLLDVQQVYKYIFEKILDEKISNDPVDGAGR